MYCEEYNLVYLLFILYMGSGIICYNSITPNNEYILLFLSFMYISYAVILLNSKLLSNV